MRNVSLLVFEFDFFFFEISSIRFSILLNLIITLYDNASVH